jgi:hypothetical protein
MLFGLLELGNPSARKEERNVIGARTVREEDNIVHRGRRRKYGERKKVKCKKK